MGALPALLARTIRGLLVHAAEWTDPMRAAIEAVDGKKNQAAILRRYGWGVPREDDVLSSTRRSVTLITQDQFIPFDGPTYQMRRFRVHDLPWPEEALRDLGEADVRLKLTLSYFVEPSPSKRGWRQRYTYPSHQLRFELRNPAETERIFVGRIKRPGGLAEEGGSTVADPSAGDRSDQRNNESLIKNIWEGAGEELAACGQVAVYLFGGRRKRNRRSDRMDCSIRHSLLLSLKYASPRRRSLYPIATRSMFL